MVHLAVEAYEVAIIKPLEELLGQQLHGIKGGPVRRWARRSSQLAAYACSVHNQCARNWSFGTVCGFV